MTTEKPTLEDFHLQTANVRLLDVSSVRGTVVSISTNGVGLDGGRFYEFGKHRAAQLTHLHIYQEVELLLDRGLVFSYIVPVASGLYDGLFQLADYGKTHLHRGCRKVSGVITDTENDNEWDIFSVTLEQEGKSFYFPYSWGTRHFGAWSEEEYKCLVELMTPGKSVDALVEVIDKSNPNSFDPAAFMVEADEGYVLVGTGRYRCCTDRPSSHKSFLWVEKNVQDDKCVCGLPSQHIDVLRQATYLNGTSEQVRCWNCQSLQLGNASAYGPTRKGIQEVYGVNNLSRVNFT